MSSDPHRVQALFLQLVPLSAADRAAALERECAGDTALRERVEALLRASDAPDSFLDRPGDEIAATMDSHAAAAESPPTTPEQSVDSLRPLPRDHAIHAAAGAVIGGRYTLQEKIGEGGMGDVWVAKQTTPVKRKVALKLIKPGMDSRAVLQRFEQERQALALMDHPNIARVLDGGMTSTGQPYFVMELVNGLSLTKFCDAAKLTLRERLELFVPICQAVQHAHQKGIVHRDLKPANILVTMIDGKPVPKVIDFGVAKATSGKLTEETMSTGFGAVVGTLEYMSPEQAGFSGDDIDTRADIYSLGVVLYELLTGLRPIDAERLRKAALTEMVRIIREEEPSKPSTRLSTDESLPSMAALRQTEPKKLMALLRGELDWVVMKCLEKQRDRRYDTANALVRDIQRYLADEVVEARPPSAGYRFKKFVRRNKGQAIAASLVFGVLLAGIIGTTWGLFEARRQEKFARSETDAKGKALENEAERVKERDAALKKEAERAKERDAANDELNHRLGVSEMLLATAAFDNRDIKLAAERLKKVPKKQRGWEWRYLKQQTNGGIFTLAGHMSAVTGVAFSPDGTLIATGSTDERAAVEVKLWDARTGAFLLELKGLTAMSRGGHSPVMCLSFSPDSARILVSGGEDKARVFDAKTGAPQFEIKTAGEIGCAVFSPDGTRIVTGFQSENAGELQIWDAQTRRPILDWKAHKFQVSRVMFSPDGTKIISGSLESTVKVWDAATGKMLLEAKGVLGNESCLAISPDGKRLVAGRDDGQRVIDAQTGEVLLVLKPRPRAVKLFSIPGVKSTVAFSPDGSRIVSGGGFDTGDPTVWDARTGTQLLELHGHTGLVISAAFSPDGTRIITGSGDGTAKVWDARIGTPRLELEGFKPGLNCAAISPDGQQIVTGQGDNGKAVATVWDARTGTPQFTLKGFKGMIRCVAFSADGTRVIIGGGVGNRDGGRAPPMTGEAKVWDARTGTLLFELQGLNEDVTGVDISRDGELIATGGGDSMDMQGREVKIWDARTGALLHDLSQLGPMRGFLVGSRVSVAFSPDGTRLAVAGARSKTSTGEAVNVWDTKTGKLKAEMQTSGGGAALCVAFSPDGKRVAAGNFSATTTVWDGDTGAPLLELKGHTGNVLSVAFSPEPGALERIVTISADQTTRVWDARTGTTLLELRGHRGLVSNVAFTADGSRILTACRAAYGDPASAKVVAWDARDRKNLVELAGHTAWITDGAFSADGTLFATASSDQTVKVWDARTGEVLLDLKGLGLKLEARSVSFSPDGTRLLTCGEGVQVWNAKTGKKLMDFKTGPFPHRVTFSIDGKRLVVESHNMTTTLWDVETGKEVHGEPIPKTLPGERISSDRRYFAQMNDNQVRIMPFEPAAEELAWRKQQAEPNVRRHRLDYLEARAAKDDFAAAFHLKLVPLEEREELLAQADEEALAELLRRAELCQSKGEETEALALYTEIANLQKDKLGTDDPATLGTLQIVGELHFRLDQFDLGVQVFESIVKTREAKLGRSHPETLDTLANLAMQYQSVGRQREAIPLLEECLPVLNWVSDPLLDAYAKTGENAKLIRLVDQQLALARKELAPDGVELVMRLYRFGAVLLEAKAFAQAEPLLRECLTIRSKPEFEFGPSHDLQGRLGAALLNQQKYAEAEPMLVQAYEGLKEALAGQVSSEATTLLVEAIDRLVQLYEGMEKPEEVKKWRAERAKHAPPARVPDGGER